MLLWWNWQTHCTQNATPSGLSVRVRQGALKKYKMKEVVHILKESFLSDKYLVSDEGFVLSQKGEPLKPSKNSHGYYIVTICVDGKPISVAVHTLVARAFCDGYSPELQVNHIDGNKENNRADNLEWVTAKENIEHSAHALGNYCGKNNGLARSIFGINKKDDSILQFDCIMDAARYFVPEGNYIEQRHIQNGIWRALKGVRKSYQGYVWHYLDGQGEEADKTSKEIG